jgi:hypothetical protein
LSRLTLLQDLLPLQHSHCAAPRTRDREEREERFTK